MELTEILKQPEGFTPPSVTVTIKKVWDYKSGESQNGPWSFQDLDVDGGRLKLKGLPEFPKAREGMTVTLTAHQSKQHGLTGMKVNHESYNNKTYDKLVITNSCKWEWGEPAKNGTMPSNQTATAAQSSYSKPETSIEGYIDHLLSCAALAHRITTVLGVATEESIQACFATVCIDTKNRGVLLPKVLPTDEIEKAEAAAIADDPFADAPPTNEINDPFDDGGPPF